jgi:uncharacterized protein YndB with AHSA1/START domain
MLKKLALVVVCAVAISLASVLGYAATKPDTFHISRTASIKAPPEKIFPLINDLRRNVSWSPFEKDPAVKRSFGEIVSGQGAVYAWDGNRDVGAGSIEITEATEPTKVEMRLNMVRPFEVHNTVEFTLEPAGNAGMTNVTWAMYGPQPLLAKIVSTFIDCEKMVGGDFEKGLANLKAVAEAR